MYIAAIHAVIVPVKCANREIPVAPLQDYPPTVRDLFIPPMPAPQAVKGFHMKAFFDVDEKGNAKLIGFNPTRDNDYNKRVAEVLRSMRFRPGVHADGTAKRDTAEIEIIF